MKRRTYAFVRRHEKRPETEPERRLRGSQRDQENETENWGGEEPRVFGAEQRGVGRHFCGSRPRDHPETAEELLAVPMLQIAVNGDRQ